VDPPELLAEPRAEAHPDHMGRVRLAVTVRNATSIQWVKNGIALKEGADGGRIKGVTTPELEITHVRAACEMGAP
jgi:hypothetical protein